MRKTQGEKDIDLVKKIERRTKNKIIKNDVNFFHSTFFGK